MSLPLLGAGPSGGGFSVLSLAPVAWFKADAITGKNDGDTISQWDDSSGNARHATQATGANQPTLQTAEINSLPVVRFDGTSDTLITSSFAPRASPTGVTMFAVSKLPVAGATFGEIATWGGTNTVDLRYHNALTLASFQAGGGNPVSNQSAGIFRVLTGRFTDATNLALLRDNGTPFTAAATDAPLTSSRTLRLGSNGAGGFFMAGDIAEVILFDEPLSDANVTLVETYLASKYAITLS